MKDELEKFIAGHREAFDDENPGEKVWENIDVALESEVKKKRFSHANLWKAAAIFFFVSSAYLLIQLNQADNKAITQENFTSNLTQEFKETEEYFVMEITQRQADIVAMENIDPQLIENFQNDINNLDSIYSELKTELSNNTNEQVINALIQNLQLRIQVLNEQKMILDNIKNAGTNEKVDI